VTQENEYLFRLRFRPPYDWSGMLAFLKPRATPGVEAVEAGIYRRSISLSGSAKNEHGYFEVSLDESGVALLARVQFGNPRALFFIVERIRAMFDLNADWAAIVASLKGDPALAARLEAHPGLRVPGCWNAFELAVRAILGQQISVKGATTLAGRIAEAFGRPLAGAGNLTRLFPTSASLADAPLTRVGLAQSRAETIRALARAVCDGRVRFEGVVDSDAFLVKLCEIPGIGNWTAQYVAMRALGEPDAFPSGDLGLLRALHLRDPREIERRSQDWRPWRAYAAMYLWRSAALDRQATRGVGRSEGATLQGEARH
jgi:AraC family transcriptional regulator, regulatory protein of adaptative response / DNA-3-methyladenine glycosylase II